jgi:hypothetical protein
MTRQKNRIHKILQDANIKLSMVATDVVGVMSCHAGSGIDGSLLAIHYQGKR